MRTLVRLSQPPRLCFVVSGRGEAMVRVWENPKETGSLQGNALSALFASQSLR